MDSRQFAHFLLDYLRVDTAMEMDQGGSTAMWVKGQASGTNGIVTNPTVAERELFNAYMTPRCSTQVWVGLQWGSTL